MDFHCKMIMEEFKDNHQNFIKIEEVIRATLGKLLKDNDLYVVAFESRIKDEKSLAGKLEIKGGKYNFMTDITDLVGARIITFYSFEVDKIASLVEKTFEVDWDNSIDKRKALATDQFGYMSLHYVCRLPKELYNDPDHPEINEYRFEIQLRTALQHVWATVNHDTGYKTDVEVPKVYLRRMIRLAGLLEIADEEFSNILSDINDYRRRIRKLISQGELDEILIDGDSFKSYLDCKPFDELNERIAEINQAEIQPGDYRPFLDLFKLLEIKTLGDLHKLIEDYAEEAYHLAIVQLGGTDLDIISSTISLRNMCIIYTAKQGGGVLGISLVLDTLGGKRESNKRRAEKIMEQLKKTKIL